jgi:ABC-type branched-subunit amino acid transport system ATPase component
MTSTMSRSAEAERGRFDEGQSAALEMLIDYLPEPVDSGPVLTGRNLSVRFGGVQALDDVAIEVPARTFVGLIGPNGAGKSTLLDVLNGFTRPDAGEVWAFGRNITNLPPWDRAKLGMSRTFQANHIDPHLTVFDNLLAGGYQLIRGGLLASTLRLGGNYRDETRARTVAGAVARLLDLERFRRVRAGSLDFGAQRRTEIGRSLMSGPRLLLLDEPLAGVDLTEAHRLMDVVKELQVRLGLSVLLVEHYVRAVLENAELIFALAQGRNIASGNPQTIAGDPAVKSAYLGE